MNKSPSSDHSSTFSTGQKSYWAPFPLCRGALKQLTLNGAELVLSELSKPELSFVILLPPDQVLERWRAQELPPTTALEQLQLNYSKALALINQGTELLMESELLGSRVAAANPLSAATMLQILTVHAPLRSVLEQLDQSTPSDDLSCKRLHNSCQSPQALLDHWWDPHQGEAQMLQQLLLQQDAQQQRFMAQWVRNSSP